MSNFLFYVKEAASLDLMTFTEVDPNSDITVDSSTKVSFTTMRRDVAAALYNNMGAGYVTGDFEFQWYFYISYGTPSSNSVATYFSLSEAFYLTRMDKYNNNDGLEISYLQGQNISLTDFKTGNEDLISVVSGPPFGWWAKLVRTGTTVVFTLYTDAERTNVAGTAQLTQSSAYTYRYLYPITSLESALFPTAVQSGYIEDIVKI